MANNEEKSASLLTADYRITNTITDVSRNKRSAISDATNRSDDEIGHLNDFVSDLGLFKIVVMENACNFAGFSP